MTRQGISGITRVSRLMLSMGVCLCAGLALLFAAGPSAVSPSPALPSEAKVAADYAKAPLSFEPNAGRTNQAVDFLSHGQDHSLFLTGEGAVLNLATSGAKTHALQLSLRGSNPAAEASGLQPLAGKVNELRGRDSSRWRTDIPTYGRVRYESVYPGIDVEWYGRRDKLEYDFRVAAGADPSQIALHAKGVESVRLAPNGDLLIEVPGRTIRQRAPVAYQEIGGRRQPVRASYEVEGRTASFNLGTYDSSRPLVIDPLIFLYSSYLGGEAQSPPFAGSSDDRAFDVAIGSDGAAYVVGETDTTDFPILGQYEGHPGDNNSHNHVFVTKFAFPSGNIVYSTYFAGDTNDHVRACAVDSSGRVAFTGDTNSTNLVPAAEVIGRDETVSSVGPGYVAQLSPGGNSVAYATYLEGTGATSTAGGDVSYDSGGNIVVTGVTTATDYPVTNGTPGHPNERPAYDITMQGTSDAFVTKLDPTQTATPANQLVYSTYFGGAGTVQTSLALDASDRIYLAGDMESVLPTTVGAFQTADDPAPTDETGPEKDWFVTKLDPSLGGTTTATAGPQLAYSTYLGSSNDEGAAGIAVDPSDATGNTVWAAGDAANADTDFPVTSGVYDDTANGFSDNVNPDYDSALAKLDTSQTGAAGLEVGTFFNYEPEDRANDVAVDQAGDPYMAWNRRLFRLVDQPAVEAIAYAAPRGPAIALVRPAAARPSAKTYGAAGPSTGSSWPAIAALDSAVMPSVNKVPAAVAMIATVIRPPMAIDTVVSRRASVSAVAVGSSADHFSCTRFACRNRL